MRVEDLKRSQVAPAWAKVPFTVDEILNAARNMGLAEQANILSRYPDAIEEIVIPAIRAPITLREKLRKNGFQPALTEAQIDDYIRFFLKALVDLGAMTEAEVQEGLRELAAG